MTNTSNKAVESIIGYKFADTDLLKTALTHGSMVDNQDSGRVSSYQRLEFLGDALLDFIIAEELYKMYPNYDEGMLTRMRANIVSKEPLAKIIDGAGLLKYLIKMNMTQDEISDKVKSDIFESLLCAVYLDSKNLDAPRAFVMRFLSDDIALAVSIDNFDQKSLLYEYCAKNKMSIEFNVVDIIGPSHQQTFKVALTLNGESICICQGSTKKKAEQECCKEARVYLGINKR